ncbi:DUF1775 domain-containing protein [Amycolatopsis sp. K13G38]|uniref:DUF1775 domain-containing protein n=1 Tax=Amycolatopsis acididurans TaxID=2724524 RepID=A0ABX1JHK0_9PSEU|nr:DUF1775 domain-containing protein [Amycolatopsis acididurans]NKQ57895.1 DUF1775 domain-containing protein [Amycolatopsis acididurans]
MPNRPQRLVRAVTVLLTAAIGVLLVAPPAMARVDIVPDHATGGDTETFAFRLANERQDTTSTKLELVFPQDPPIAYAQIDPFPGWTMSITPRPLNPPVKVGDHVVDQVVGSIVIQGGAVPPHQFKQFQITLGPLPRDGRLVFQSIQTFANGDVERLTTPPTPGQTTPAAPVITIGSDTGAAAAAPQSAAANQGDAPSALAIPGDSNETASSVSSSALPLTLLWVALGLAILIIAAVAFRARKRSRTVTPTDAGDIEEAQDIEAEEVSNR